MKLNFDSLAELVFKETAKAVNETVGTYVDSDEKSERDRQEKQAKAVKERGLTKGSKTEVDEADEETETGVPKDVDAEEKRGDRTGGKGTKDSAKLKTPSKKTLKKATVGSVIDKLNALRGGKSLKDEDVRKSFGQYFEALTQQERQSLLIFLTGIAQILAGVEQGTDAIDPGDVGLRVKGETPTPKPKSDGKKSPETAAAGEETPILVGETKRMNQKIMAAYKKLMVTK